MSKWKVIHKASGRIVCRLDYQDYETACDWLADVDPNCYLTIERI